MAAFSLDDAESFDWQAFSDYVENSLPKYARPLFIRIIQEMDTTGTFKLKKNDLRNEAFDIGKVSDPIYCLKPNSSNYVALAPTQKAAQDPLHIVSLQVTNKLSPK